MFQNLDMIASSFARLRRPDRELAMLGGTRRQQAAMDRDVLSDVGPVQGLASLVRLANGVNFIYLPTFDTQLDSFYFCKFTR